LLTVQVQVTYGQGHVKVTFELEIQVGHYIADDKNSDETWLWPDTLTVPSSWGIMMKIHQRCIEKKPSDSVH
jgi:hypothetical protein